MLSVVVRALITLCVIALCFFLVIWVLGAIGIVLPAIVIKILGVILVLVAILILIKLFQPWIGRWFGP